MSSWAEFRRSNGVGIHYAKLRNGVEVLRNGAFAEWSKTEEWSLRNDDGIYERLSQAFPLFRVTFCENERDVTIIGENEAMK